MLWTIDCDLLSSAELLIREVASAASLSKLVNALNVTDFKFPDAPIVCGLSGLGTGNELVQDVFGKKEVDRIVVNAEQRRVDLRWTEIATPPRWIHLPEKYRRFTFERDRRYDSFFTDLEVGLERKGKRPKRWTNLNVPNDGVVIDVPSGEIAVIAFNEAYLVPGSEIATFARQSIKKMQDDLSLESVLVVRIVLDIIGEQIHGSPASIDLERIRKLIRQYEQYADSILRSRRIEDLFDFDDFVSLLMRTNWKTYDPSVWRRRYEE